MFIPAPCSHCPTAQRAIWGFLPLWGVKGAKNRESGCKKRAFLLGFSYLRASPIWPDFGSWQAGQICAFLASRTRHNAKLPLVTDLLQAVASVTASRVAYCDARNRRISQTHQLLKFSLPKSIPRPAPFAKFPPRFLSSVFQPKFPSKTADSPAPSTACRHSAEWAGHDQRQ